MRLFGEIVIASLLLVWCLAIRWPTGSESSMAIAEGIAPIQSGIPEVENSSGEVGRWENLSEGSFRLLLKDSQQSKAEMAGGTLSWLGSPKIYANPRGEILIGEGSQLWSRDLRAWRAWMVRDAWELKSAQWEESAEAVGDGVWRLEWQSPQGELISDWRDRDLQIRIPQIRK
jgi:hypothetical protein